MAKLKPQIKSHKEVKKPPFECVALLLQGGGALGAYQAGVYQALSEANLEPDWVAGISIGAINCAIIAGNAPKDRVAKLRAFWEKMSTNTVWDMISEYTQKYAKGDLSHTFLNQSSAAGTMLNGIPGFFKPRPVSPWFQQEGSIEATSYYDTCDLYGTLKELIDFDRINAHEMRMSLSAVDIRSGNFVVFDSTTDQIGPEHIMASGALPPGFPAIEIDGEYFWDGGLVSNTPLEWVLDTKDRQDTLIFQVDLWNARGELPRNMAEVMTRQKEILYSSRTRAATDKFKKQQKMRNAFSKLFAQMPDSLKKTHEAKILSASADPKVYNIIHLIYRARSYEGDSKDYEFSKLSMEEHWKAGYHDTVRTLRYPQVVQRPTNHEGVFTFDIAEDGRG